MGVLDCGEVFVFILKVVVDEVLVLLEVVVLALQELVHLDQPRAVLSFSVLLTLNKHFLTG